MLTYSVSVRHACVLDICNNFVSINQQICNFFGYAIFQLRSRNPTCVFLDPTSPTTSSNWSNAGVFTVVTGTAGAEFKEYDVQCISPHLTAFAVAVEETTSVRHKRNIMKNIMYAFCVLFIGI